MQDIAKTVEWLSAGADDVIHREWLAQKLEQSQKSGKPLTIKLGVDPTAPDIHFGHTVVLEKLRQFQELGHQVVFLIGDMTARVGDPSGRSATRKALSDNDVKIFAQSYVEQVEKILPIGSFTVRYNSEWFAAMDFSAMIRLLSQATVARILERDDFHQRFAGHAPIYLHELAYPLMQGYDSVMLHADVELGGTDQRFNIMTARQLQEAYGQSPEVGMFMPLLEGTDGVKKMSKSLGNYICVTENPEEMFGKIMSIPDDLIVRWAHLLLAQPKNSWEERLQSGENPRNVKADLACRLVSRFWGEAAGTQAQEAFDRVFKEHALPEEMPTVCLPSVPWQVGAIELVASLPGIPSRQEARRLLQQGAVTLENHRVEINDQLSIAEGSWIRVGKRRYFRFSGEE
ncbi:MAG: tyrosine--tRNA ligase [Firmicutes bacterium]|nr:tyrosine--tRNA ligase [Bacillota bacterium]